MASTKSIFVGILLLATVYNSFGFLVEVVAPTNQLVAISNDGTTAVSQITVPTDASYTTYDNDQISINVHIKIDHPHVSELKIQLVRPGVSTPITILRGNVNPSCTGKNIDATFTKYSDIPHHAPFEKCDTITEGALVTDNVRPVDSLTPASGNIAGNYELRITDLYGADFVGGNLVNWTITISDDFDGDSVDNEDDNCPLVENPIITYMGNPYQPDENANGVGNECECDYKNYEVTDGDLKICYYLDNWGKDSKHYKGLLKERGDWVPLVMPNRYLGEFQPGDYSHKGTWLDCECNSYAILP